MKGYNPRFLKMHGKFQDVVVSQQNNVPVVRDRVFENPTKSQAQIENQVAFKSTTQGWKLLDPDGRESYTELGARMLGKSGKPMKGHNCYTSITQTRALMSEDPLDMAPNLPDASPVLPSPLFLSAVNNGTCHILIHCAGAVGPILLEACPWISAGVSYFSKSNFRVCTVLNGLLLGGTTDITAAITARFSTPPAGAQMVIRLTPLTETGFRGATTTYAAFVAPTEEAMLADLDKRKAKLAKKGKLKLVAA